MFAARSRLRMIHWLACLALLMAALAPTVSRVLAASDPVLMQEICSVDGLRRVVVDQDQGTGSGDPATLLALDHCGYCTLAQHDPAVLPADVQNALATERHPAFPAAYAVVYAASRLLTGPPSHAPPAA